MVREVLAVLMTALFLSGCTAEMQRRSETRYLEQDLICSIDTSVANEVDRLLPSGFLTKPYSPDLWKTYWEGHLARFAKEDFSRERERGYAGPSGRVLALYLLSQRREAGLPDLVGSSKTDGLIAQLYDELHRGDQSSCAILKRNSPVCHHSPAQRTGSLTLQRHCRVAPNDSFKPTPLRGAA